MFRAFRNIFFGFSAFLFFSCSLFKPKNSSEYETRIEMITSEGTFRLKLYNETPLHRDNFKKLVENKFYDGIKFHRVINGFMAQAGDLILKRMILKDNWAKIVKEKQFLQKSIQRYFTRKVL